MPCRKRLAQGELDLHDIEGPTRFLLDRLEDRVWCQTFSPSQLGDAIDKPVTGGRFALRREGVGIALAICTTVRKLLFRHYTLAFLTGRSGLGYHTPG